MSEKRPAPYPADTRARGWRFELDYERIEQSDTWSLAAEVPMAQHALMFLWLAAWKREPCGSMPADHGLFRAACRVPLKSWPAMRPVLMRGWWLADDGRLYHPTITARVLEMLDYRRKNAERVAKFKAAKREQRAGNALPTQQQQVKNDTGTGTGRDSSEYSHDAGGGGHTQDDGEFIAGDVIAGFRPTQAGALCGALRRAGIADTNPGHPRLLALLEAGAQEAEFTGFVRQATAKAPGAPFAYLLAMVEGERTRAASGAAGLHRGAMPNKQEALEQRNKAVGQSWAAKMQSEGVVREVE